MPRKNIISSSHITQDFLQQLNLQDKHLVNLSITFETAIARVNYIEKEVPHHQQGYVVNLLGQGDFYKQLNKALGFEEGERFCSLEIEFPAAGVVLVLVEKYGDNRLMEMDWSVLTMPDLEKQEAGE